MKSVLTLLFWIDVVVLNVGVGYLIYVSQRSVGAVDNAVATAVKNETTYVDQCGAECKKYVDSMLIAKNTSVEPTMKTTVVPTVTPKSVSTSVPTKVRRVSYVTIPGGGGGTTETNWIDVPGSEFYFDTKDYSGLVEIYLESTMQLINGSGMAYVRLYDATHGIGVQGSDIQTNSNSSTIVVSGKLNPWAGRNLMRIQVRSLTTETAQFIGGRLRIVTEN